MRRVAIFVEILSLIATVLYTNYFLIPLSNENNLIYISLN